MTPIAVDIGCGHQRMGGRPTPLSRKGRGDQPRPDRRRGAAATRLSVSGCWVTTPTTAEAATTRPMSPPSNRARPERPAARAPTRQEQPWARSVIRSCSAAAGWDCAPPTEPDRLPRDHHRWSARHLHRRGHRDPTADRLRAGLPLDVRRLSRPGRPSPSWSVGIALRPGPAHHQRRPQETQVVAHGRIRSRSEGIGRPHRRQSP